MCNFRFLSAMILLSLGTLTSSVRADIIPDRPRVPAPAAPTQPTEPAPAKADPAPPTKPDKTPPPAPGVIKGTLVAGVFLTLAVAGIGAILFRSREQPVKTNA